MHQLVKYPFRWIVTLLGKKRAKQFRDEPIFIGGCGRSGTTLLLSIISAHPSLFCHPKELGIFNGSSYSKDGCLKLKNEHRLYQSFVFNSIPAAVSRWCEKSPNNIKHLEKIDRFTNGGFKFVQIVRDGRDVILSRHPKNPDKFWVDAERWIQDVSLGLELSKDPRVFTIRYEDLITNYDETILGVCEHLRIDFNDLLKNWHANARVKSNRAFDGRMVKPLNANSIGKWKKSADQDRLRSLVDDPLGRSLLEHYDYI